MAFEAYYKFLSIQDIEQAFLIEKPKWNETVSEGKNRIM